MKNLEATQDYDDENNLSAISICSIFMSERQLGLSHYSETENILYVDRFECSIDTLADILQCVKLTCAPTLFLIHPQFLGNPSFMEILQAGCDGSAGVYPFKVVKSSLWNVEAAKLTLVSKVRLTSEDKDVLINQWSFQSRLLEWSSVFDIDSAALLKSLGVLLNFIQDKCFQLDDGVISLSDIKQLQLNDVMRIDAASFKALHIFTEEFHPNVIRSKGKSKEGYSLYSLFDRTKSAAGGAALKSWLLRPLFNVDSITHRQNGIELTMRSENQEFIHEISGYLKNISSVPRLLLKIKKVSATYNEWVNLHKTILATIRLLEATTTFSQSATSSEDRHYITNMFRYSDVRALRNISEFLFSAIDFDATESGRCVYIREGYNQSLDTMRQTFDTLPTELNQAALAILDQSPLLQNVSVEYIPQFGYMVAVDRDDILFLDLKNSSFEFKYEVAEEQKCYYKCEIVYMLDDRIGDIRNNILDYQKQIILEIEESILENETQLNSVSYSLGELDALIALGEVALERNYVRPDIESSSHVIVIKNGRHPLQEMTSTSSFIPNDTCLLSDKNIALITGANGSGKTVYIKQVGLLVYLAHIGSFLPCDKAIIGLTDRIMTRIASTETVSSAQSAFTLDLNQVSSMLRLHTARSLCLIDEFGKGTSPIDGISLLSVTISHFSKFKSKVFFVLHFLEAIDAEILPIEATKSLTLFNMCCHEQGEYDENEALSMPLYKLRLGAAKSSEGIPCARLAGIPQCTLERAIEIRNSIASGNTIRSMKETKMKRITELMNEEILLKLLGVGWESSTNEEVSAFKMLLAKL